MGCRLENHLITMDPLGRFIRSLSTRAHGSRRKHNGDHVELHLASLLPSQTQRRQDDGRRSKIQQVRHRNGDRRYGLGSLLLHHRTLLRHKIQGNNVKLYKNLKFSKKLQ